MTDSQQPTSPVFNDNVQNGPASEMDFFDALRAVYEGHRVTKNEWASTNIYVCMRVGVLIIHKEDGSDYQWIISDGDMAGTDWVILPQKFGNIDKVA